MPVASSFTMTGFDDNAIDDESYDPDGCRAAVLGKLVTKDAFTLPAGTEEAIFTIAGGRVLVTSIVGRVTTTIQTQANNMKLIANPTVGSDVDLCAVLNVSADAVGDLYAITGTLADALVGAGAAVAAQAKPVIVPAGTIDLSTSATNTGATAWELTYIPLTAGATVVAA